MVAIRTVIRHEADGLWADVPLSKEWQVSYRLMPQGPRPVIVEARVTLREGAELPRGGLSGAVLRTMRVGSIVNVMSQLLALLWARPGTEAPRIVDEYAKMFPFLRAEAPAKRHRRPAETPGRRGRRPLSDLLLAEAAKIYLDAIARGSERPVIEAARQMKQTAERLRDLLHRARVRGLLVGGIAGVAGGRLSPAGKAVLRRSAVKRRSKAVSGRKGAR